MGNDDTTPLQQEEVATVQTVDICDNRKCSSDTAEGERDTNKDESLMPSWTEALHSVASTIIHLLGIPPQLALQEESCQCLSSNNTNNDMKHNRCQRCNIDLLRIFRYDAVDSPVDSHLPNNDNDEPHVIGSSPHSDWGTMTIVWQDDKGGLQTYCHACDVWSDVDASSSTKTEDTTTDKCGESSTANHISSSIRRCSLFVHIGDFLSLASIKSRDGSCDFPMWPSPRHRVLCPTIRHENNKTVDNSKASARDCRRSLVYFAYPPPNISLDTVQKVISPIISSNDSSIQSTKTTINNESNTRDFYNHYSLLHNQSQQQSSLVEGKDTRSMEERKDNTKEMSSFQAYQTIKNLSFDKVIKDKWNQVQR